MDIKAEARRMMRDDRYAWEMLGRYKNYFKDGNFGWRTSSGEHDAVD